MCSPGLIDQLILMSHGLDHCSIDHQYRWPCVLSSRLAPSMKAGMSTGARPMIVYVNSEGQSGLDGRIAVCQRYAKRVYIQLVHHKAAEL